MKKIRIINNPSSGRNTVQKRLSSIVEILLERGYTISKFSTKKKEDAMLEAARTCEGDWDIIIACGGDGTINEVANGVARSERKVPVAILPAGTVNDFANFLSLPSTPDAFCDMIESGNTIDVDLGKLNDRYFVNVAAVGMFSDVAYKVPKEQKKIMGRMAYYLEGLKGVANQIKKSMVVNIESDEFSSTEEISLMLVSNSTDIGGIKNISPYAEVQDGKLECLIIRKLDAYEAIPLFISVAKGGHIDSPLVEYFKTDMISISSADRGESIPVDLDGELGGSLPITIEVEGKGLKVFVPSRLGFK